MAASCLNLGAGCEPTTVPATSATCRTAPASSVFRAGQSTKPALRVLAPLVILALKPLSVLSIQVGPCVHLRGSRAHHQLELVNSEHLGLSS